MHLFKSPIKYFRGDPWTIMEEGFDPAYQRVSESVFSMANEFMGVRGYFDEGYSGDHLLGSYFNHLYEMMDIHHDQVFKGFITQGAAMINAVDWLYTRIWLDGEQLDLAKSKFSNFFRQLDMRQGIFKRGFIWETRNGKQLLLTFTRFVDMESTHIGCQRITMEPLNFSGKVQILSGLDFNTHYEIGSGWNQTGKGNNQQDEEIINFWKCTRKGNMDGGWAIQAQTNRSGHQLFSSFRLNSTQALDPILRQDEKFIGVVFSLELQQGAAVTVDKITVNAWQKSLDVEAVWSQGLELSRKYASVSFDSALAEHISFWKKVWAVLDIDIEGDPEVLQGLRFSCFQTYQTYHGENPDLNALCKGMTG